MGILIMIVLINIKDHHFYYFNLILKDKNNQILLVLIHQTISVNLFQFFILNQNSHKIINIL